VTVVYRIAKFNEVFTKRDGRKDSGELRWVSMPIDFMSSGYQALIEDFGNEAAAIFGAWCALVKVAAKCPTPGLLCSSRGRAITPERAASLAYLSADPFRKLFEWASSQEIGWLEVVTHPEAVRTESEDCPDDPPDEPRKKTGLHNKTLHNTTGRQSTGNDSSEGDATASKASPSGIAPPDPAKVKRFGDRVGKPNSRKDQILAWKLVALEQVLGEAWLANIATAVNEVAVRPNKPWAYAWKVAAAGSHERAGPGEERLKRLLASVPDPPDDWPRTRGSPE
jgi:hypothetical protein